MSAFLETRLPTLAKWAQAGRRCFQSLEARTPTLLKIARRVFWVFVCLLGWGLLGGLATIIDPPSSSGPGPMLNAFLAATLILVWLTPIALTIYAVAKFASYGPGLASVALRMLLGCAAVLGIIALGASGNLGSSSDLGLAYLGMFVAMGLGPLAFFGGLVALILWPIGLWQALQRRRDRRRDGRT